MIEALHSRCSSVQILSITGGSECVKVGFKNFRAEDVDSIGLIEPMFVVEVELSSRRCIPTSEFAVGRNKGETFRSDAGSASGIYILMS